MKKKYKIQKGIPIPEKENITKYPFKEMRVGDSFFMVTTHLKSPAGGVIRTKVWSYNNLYNKKIVVDIRKEKNGVRVWRIK